MFDCETCRSQMLESLYDLLEGDEKQAFEAHLQDCAGCQAELVQAKGQQQLLAKAAKMEFADVRFTAPAPDTTTAIVGQAFQPDRQARKPDLRWRRWLAAAAVLLALGAAVPAVWYGRDYRHTQETLALAEGRIDQAKKDRAEAEQQLARLPHQTQERRAAIHKAQRDRQLQVRVQGPAGIRAGAPTDYQIYTTNLNGQPTAAKVSVDVKDHGQTLGKSIAVARVANGVYRLTLPPDLPVRPKSQPTLVVSARRDNGSQVELREEMTLAAPVYVTHLEIDKPMYQLGETVHFRSLTLDRFSLKPAEQDLNLQFVLAMPGPGSPERVIAQGRTALFTEGPNGTPPVLGPDNKPLRGLGAGSFTLDESWPGGEYSLIVREAGRRFPEQRRKFLVNKYEKPKLNKELDFSRKSYGPGDEVVARCKAKYLDGRPLKNCRVEVAVVIDSKQYGSHGEEKTEAFAFRTDDEGLVPVRFRLPKEIERGLGTVSVKFDDRAMPDTMVRPIPIVLKKLDIEFCPEGGDLVAGLRNRVYFQVRSTLGKPADLKGQLLEDGKPLGVTVETLASEKTPELNQGMGRFEFTPRVGHKYELKVESPVGVTKRHELPAIKPDGVVLSIPNGVVKAEETIPVTVRSTVKRSFMIGAYCRGRLLDSTELTLPSRSQAELGNATGNEARAVLRPASGAGGVCRVTVFEILPGDGARRALRPVAERLIYRQPAERVQLALKPDQKTYVPRQTVKLGVEATTEKGEPAPAVVMLRVVDKSVVTLADDKTLRSMPTHFLLTTEVRRPEDLEYADFLLGTHSQAADALDLLLGTQGWRRFAEQDPNKFRHEQKEEAERLLVTIGQSQPQMTDLTQKELERVESEHTRRTEELTAQAAQARKAEQDARESPDYHAALVKLKAYDDFFDRMRLVGVPVLAAILALTALVCLLLGVFHRLGRALPYYAAAVACVAVVVFLAKVAWHNEPASGHREQEVASLVAPQKKQEKLERLAEERAALDKGDEAAEMKLNNGVGAMLPRAAGRAAKPGIVPQAAQGMAPGMPDAAKDGFGNRRDRLGEGKDAAKMEQFAKHKGEKEQLDIRKALPQAQLQLRDKADRAFGEQPQMRFDGKAGARAAMPPMAPGKAGDVAFKRLLEKRPDRKPNPWPPMPVRVFAHPRAAGPAEERYDFAETLYWHPVLVLPGGKTEVSFDLCDSLGAFEVTAFAHTLDGRLGSATQTLTSRKSQEIKVRSP